MNYWNSDNFEGLKAIGTQYSALKGYELFGQYCLQKEQGLKKQAIATVNQFVSHCKSLSLAEQRHIAEELSSLGFGHSETHQLLAYPLIVLLKGVLTQWTLDEPNNPIPHKWLGFIAGDTDSYERALALEPSDEICLTQVALSHLNSVDFQTHHLSESVLLGDISRAKDSLASAQALITRLQTIERKSRLQNRHDYYLSMVNCWEEYSTLAGDEPFPDWCAAKGEQFDFWSIVYYQR
ncbi:hypothetical protein N7V09_14900 [Shewanella seohaensis]|uniref:hypothetical protein n=1 Tax=Shewanella seohaensis TaxID=755175 RepID=UPI00200DB03B|nr:hypothetical protein [Shewanella seohaensis]MCL1121281.1 hypothetical protein [Shewanella seohaensis]UXM81116.1 hypothetical protein N7V09_14900 [Shewanella seohaensis]